MASHFEVFDKLREFGKSLDNSSKVLPKFTNDDDEEPINKARALLQLRAMLTEVKTIKDDVKQSLNNTRQDTSFDQFLTICEKHADKMREDIENLEEHLAKYGYQKKLEKLPDMSLVTVEDADNNDVSEQSSSESPQLDSDKENQACSEPEETVFNFDQKYDVKEELPSAAVEPEEVDFLLTPVRPITMIKLMQDSTSYLPTQENTPTLYVDINTDPIPPVTTTPLLPPRQNLLENFDFNTPDSASELPVQPATRTPMIKSFNPNALSPEPEVTLVDDFPTPPVFRTPGLRRYGLKQHGVPLGNFNKLETPSPPSLTSVHILNPDDIPNLMKASAVFQLSPSPVKETFPAINQESFRKLPECLQKQFSLEQVNQLIRKTNHLISSKDGVNSGYASNDELVSALNLGPMKRPFILLMVQLNYFAI